jgi:hypothetical protein
VTRTACGQDSRSRNDDFKEGFALVQKQLGISVVILRLTDAKECRVINGQVPCLAKCVSPSVG